MIFNLEEVQYQLDEATTRIKKLEELNTALMKNDESRRVELARVNRILAITEERVREHEAHENQTHEVLGKILGTDDILENVARRAVNRIAELEEALVEERARGNHYGMSYEDAVGDGEFERWIIDGEKDLPKFYLDRVRAEARRQLKEEGKIGPDAKPRSWQITEEWREALEQASHICHEVTAFDTAKVLRAMLEEAGQE